jgi:hypothetical protein
LFAELKLYVGVHRSVLSSGWFGITPPEPLGHFVPHLGALVGVGVIGRLTAEVHLDHRKAELS